MRSIKDILKIVFFVIYVVLIIVGILMFLDIDINVAHFGSSEIMSMKSHSVRVAKTVYFYLFTASMTMAIMVVIANALKFMVKPSKEYVRDPEQVVEPIIAESLIDGKIGAKELIMGCVIDLINRGNIEVIDDKKIKLLDYERTTPFEKEIIEIIFGEGAPFVTHGEIVGKTISFKQIDDVFHTNAGSMTVYDKFYILKERIISKMIDLHIFSQFWEISLRVIKGLCIVVNFLLLMFLAYSNKLDSNMIIYIYLAGAGFIAFMKYSPMRFMNIRFEDKLGNGNFFFIDLLLLISISLFFSLIFRQTEYLLIAVYYTFLFMLNIFTFLFADVHVLTSTGKIEYKKACGLRDFIVDYSLIDERDIDASIIWDSYLAYSAAFGIPNKILDKIDEQMLFFNAEKQLISKIIVI